MVPRRLFISRADVIYAINRSTSRDFEALVYCNPVGSGMDWRWFQLRPPPYVASDHDCTIQSYALLGDGRTICFSSVPSSTSAGGRYPSSALHVPQIFGLYFGFLDSNPESLVALDLSSPLAPPKVLHPWRGFGPPDPRGDWSLMYSNLLYLGNHRFCVAKFFGIFGGSVELSEKNLVDMAGVLTGVEIVNTQPDKAKLRMIKHKTRTYIFEGCSIESLL